jgi:hypothetical protein
MSFPLLLHPQEKEDQEELAMIRQVSESPLSIPDSKAIIPMYRVATSTRPTAIALA